MITKRMYGIVRSHAQYPTLVKLCVDYERDGEHEQSMQWVRYVLALLYGVSTSMMGKVELG